MTDYARWHACPIQIRWGDLDAMGHVNNATYLTYCEQARLEFIGTIGLWDGKLDSLGLIMARAEIDYKLPLTDRDAIIVYTRVGHIGTKSFQMEQHIVRQSDPPALAAAAIITGVAFDYKRGQSAPIPQVWRDKLAPYSVGGA